MLTESELFTILLRITILTAVLLLQQMVQVSWQQALQHLMQELTVLYLVLERLLLGQIHYQAVLQSLRMVLTSL